VNAGFIRIALSLMLVFSGLKLLTS
jgi:hypothetical protein